MIPFTGNAMRAVPQSNSGIEIEEFFDTEAGKNGDDQVFQSAPLPPRELPDSLDKVQYSDELEDFDAIYEDESECDAGNAVESEHGTVLMHLLSQVGASMDLTKMTLPAFVLEPRSLLEMYADFFSHPDDFVAITDMPTSEQRFVSVVQFYLSSFYAARKTGVAKKPYNPILGEIFRCRWHVPGTTRAGQIVRGGPFPGSDANELTFLAEQVCHHPPISAFYAEHPGAKISFDAHIRVKSSLAGLSIGVKNIGFGTITLHAYDEKYVFNFPTGYIRSIMSKPWLELGGKVRISCASTGFSADVEFLTKSFFGGKSHRIVGTICRGEGEEGKPLLKLKGEWNGIVIAKPANGDKFVLCEKCDRLCEQDERESRSCWRHVTCALKRNRPAIAAIAKRAIEQQQRDEAKQRLVAGVAWQPKYFRRCDGDTWQFADSLSTRLGQSAAQF